MKIFGFYKVWSLNGVDEVQDISVETEGVLSIDYHEPSGTGDAHYVDLLMVNGGNTRIFHPDQIAFFNMFESGTLNV